MKKTMSATYDAESVRGITFRIRNCNEDQGYDLMKSFILEVKNQIDSSLMLAGCGFGEDNIYYDEMEVNDPSEAKEILDVYKDWKKSNLNK